MPFGALLRRPLTISAARSHIFADLAATIDDAFAAWDRADLHQFWVGHGDGQRISIPDPYAYHDGDVLDDRKIKLSLLPPGERFAYEFDFGDSWLHRCTRRPDRIAPSTSPASSPTAPCPPGDGATSPTAAAGTATTANRRPPPDPVA